GAGAGYDVCGTGGPGAYRLTFKFGGASTVVDPNSSGVHGTPSLADGNYRLDLAAGGIQGGGRGGPGLANPQSATFWRRFGDVVTGTTTATATNGDRAVNDADKAAMSAALRGRLGMANFRYDLDLDGNNTIDTVDYYAF